MAATGDVDFDGIVTRHDPVEVTVSGTRLSFGLQPGYPNPFNPAITLQYNVINDGETSLEIYDLRGHLVEVLVNKHHTTGSYKHHWFPQDLSSGVYMVRLQSGKLNHRQKIIYMK